MKNQANRQISEGDLFGCLGILLRKSGYLRQFGDRSIVESHTFCSEGVATASFTLDKYSDHELSWKGYIQRDGQADLDDANFDLVEDELDRRLDEVRIRCANFLDRVCGYTLTDPVSVNESEK